MRPLRVLHCPAMVGGHPQQLARAEREIGLASRAVSFHPNAFGYEGDEILFDPRAGPVRWALARWRLLWRALRHFDVVHFNFGRTIAPAPLVRIPGKAERLPAFVHRAYAAYARALELRDLPLLKRLGKGVAVTFQGDDIRRADWMRAHCEIHPADEAGYYGPESDAHKRFVVERFARHADRLFALNPDLLHLLPPRARFVPYAHLDLREWRRAAPRPDLPERPLVVHAPSHRGVKGTRFLLEAVERLKAEGVAFEFRLVEGLARREARRLYEQADLLVDQLLVGWYGGLAVELMALETPVVCYLREGDLRFLPEGMRRDLPLWSATPDTLTDLLRDLLTVRRGELRPRGRASRAFAERWHDPLRIARELAGEYERIAKAPRGGRP